MSYMARRRQPTPEELAGRSERTVTFRMHAADHEALVQLAKRTKVGHTTLARRIVEDYLRNQPRNARR